jgi:short-subunit dehydrogenase
MCLSAPLESWFDEFNRGNCIDTTGATMNNISGKWALVTGASSGIGSDLARNLAAAGCHLILTARRKDRLDALKKELEGKHAITIETISNDLSTPAGPRELFEATQRLNVPVSVLINNAGIGLNGQFADLDLSAQLALIQLNIASLTELTHRYLEAMKSREEGWILNVASLYAFNLGPGYAVYAASKHYVLNLSESLHYEMKNRGVHVTALCPGPTQTEFFDVSGQGSNPIMDKVLMKSDKVAKIGLKAMLEGKPYVVPGLTNSVMAESIKFVPKSIQAIVSSQISK